MTSLYPRQCLREMRSLFGVNQHSRFVLHWCLYLAVTAFAAFSATGEAGVAVILGEVVAVLDGDTLTLLDTGHQEHRIRISGIDAPEKSQPYGAASKKYLSNRAFHRPAQAWCHKRDRYNRQVCTVVVDEADLGLALVRAGLAWHYKRFAVEQTAVDRAQYAEAEDYARAAKVGLWQEQSPIPPWEWRQIHRLKALPLAA